jgi:hypothetical protein
MEAPLYLLLDSSIFAGYYAPQTLNQSGQSAGLRIENIIESVRKGCSPHLKLLVPEICVAEAQTVLSKHANPKWKGKKKSDDPQSIHAKTYRTIVKKMRDDLHGGRLIESIPLQRYHVLAKHFITPIDHRLHLKQENGSGRVNELGGTDQLICGMAIWLARTFGSNRLVVLTVDYRQYKVLEKARRITESQARAYGLLDIADDIGCAWSANMYPQVVHLAKATDANLRKLLGSWPLATLKKKSRISQRDVMEADIDLLVTRYRAVGIARDRLPYTPQMENLTRQFNEATGHRLNEGEVWKLLIARLKQGDGKVTESAKKKDP